ncbi:unnamed protein product [Enterobius vermicularis]|uniref:NAB domain-containing protein n=1 Tax=Enterobius vermicularis TaxID=51028 RepID=A0A0N4UV50_ENTVE|nr:unnamed protein product [Enterobius vermicularis]
MEENTDTFGELVMLCEDFMQTAIGVNSNFQSSNWLASLHDYKERAKGISKSRASQQKLQQETSLKIQRLEELSLAAKENVSSLKKKIDDDEHGLTNFKQRLSGLNNEGQELRDVADRLKAELVEEELNFHRAHLKESIRQRNRLQALLKAVEAKKMEFSEGLHGLESPMET